MRQGCVRCGGAVIQSAVNEDGEIRSARQCSACGCDQDFPGRAPTKEERHEASVSHRVGHIGSKEDALPYFGRAGQPSHTRRAALAARMQQVARAI